MSQSKLDHELEGPLFRDNFPWPELSDEEVDTAMAICEVSPEFPYHQVLNKVRESLRNNDQIDKIYKAALLKALSAIGTWADWDTPVERIIVESKRKKLTPDEILDQVTNIVDTLNGEFDKINSDDYKLYINDDLWGLSKLGKVVGLGFRK